jgi:hypothetical protein
VVSPVSESFPPAEQIHDVADGLRAIAEDLGLCPSSIEERAADLRIDVQPAELGDWERWRSLLGASRALATSVGHASKVKGHYGGVVICLVGYGVPRMEHAQFMAREAERGEPRA